MRDRAIKELQELNDKAKSERYASVPAFAVPPSSKFTDKTANGLTKAILTFLQLKGHWATRVNTTGRYIPGQTWTDVVGRGHHLPGKYIPGTTRLGTPDINASIQGLYVGLEIKIGRDKQSDHQKKVQQEILQDSGQYWLIQNFDEFIEKYNNLTSKRK